MKKLFSTNYSAAAFNIALLILRIGVGAMMAKAGYNKLVHYNEILHGTMPGAPPFPFGTYIGLPPNIGLALLIFAEFFCSCLLIIGLFTRLASIPLIISSAVALCVAHNGEVFGGGQMITLFLLAYIVILLVGPGKASIDGMVSK
jgi:putative oxidoreductase